MSKHFLSLLLVKMLIPAMATGGISMEIEATHLLDLASLSNATPVAVYADAGIPEPDAVTTVVNCEIVACAGGLAEAADVSAPMDNEEVSEAPALHLVRFKEECAPVNSLESEVKLPEAAFI